MVREMFDDIAPRYDLLNSILSAGIHKGWKRKVIKSLRETEPENILDVACGTCDLAIMAARIKPKKIIACDISEQMLAIGKRKVEKKELGQLIQLMLADAEKLPFGNETFDAITVGFGVRNFETLEKGLGEMLRVLKPGGRLVVLEFSQPTKSPFRQLYNLYFTCVLPFIGKLISRNHKAYQYLPDSVIQFPAGKDFLFIMNQIGYKNTHFQSLTFGIASLYVGEK